MGETFSYIYGLKTFIHVKQKKTQQQLDHSKLNCLFVCVLTFFKNILLLIVFLTSRRRTDRLQNRFKKDILEKNT